MSMYPSIPPPPVPSETADKGGAGPTLRSHARIAAVTRMAGDLAPPGGRGSKGVT